MTVEEIYIKLRDDLTADNESSSSPERIFIKNQEQTICTLGMNRSHEIIFVEFKPAPKDLIETERESFVHPHPVEMLHDAGWRQAQITTMEEAQKLLTIIGRSYKKKKTRAVEETPRNRKTKIAALKAIREAREKARRQMGLKSKPEKGAAKKGASAGPSRPAKPAAKPAAKPKARPKPKPKAKPKAKAKAKPKAKPKIKPKVKAKAKVKAKPKARKAAKKKKR